MLDIYICLFINIMYLYIIIYSISIYVNYEIIKMKILIIFIYLCNSPASLEITIKSNHSCANALLGSTEVEAEGQI